MRRAVLEQILRSRDRVTVEGERFSIGEGLHLDLLVTAGHEVITLPKLRSITLGELQFAAVTEKDEIYHLEYEAVLGVRTKESPVSRSAGFTP